MEKSKCIYRLSTGGSSHLILTMLSPCHEGLHDRENLAWKKTVT
jgi:hypothetical protein